MNRHFILGLAGALCASAAALAQTPDDDTIVIAQSVDAPTLDPADISSRNASNIAVHMFGSLYVRTEIGRAHV